LGRDYERAERWVQFQEYEKAKRTLEQIITDQNATPEKVFYSKLLLAQIYSEGRELGKSLELYNSVSSDKDYDMPADHVCRYLDLLRRSGFISKAIEVAKRYHSDLSLNDRFVNIESALNSYYQYYQTQKSGKYIDASPVRTPNDLENSYAYGIIPYGSDYLLLMNRYNYSDLQSFYTNAKIILLSKKSNPNNTSASFSELGGFVQQGPATFLNNNKTVIFTANQYNKYNTGNRPYASVNRLQLYSSTQKKNGKWTRPVNISGSFVRKASNYSFMAPSADQAGKKLYFASDMEGGFGGTDIYYCSYDEKYKKWGTPVNMGYQVNTNGDELFPYVKNDTLLFSSNGLVGFGDQDIYLKKISATTEPAVHLPYPVNTQFKDTSPMFDFRTNTLFFASDRNSQKTGYILDQVYSLVSGLTELIVSGGRLPSEEKPIEKDTTGTGQIKDLVADKLDTDRSDKTKPSLRDTMDIIQFEFNKYVIRKDQYSRLDSVYSSFISDPSKSTIAVDGHTDITGTERYNLTLSEMRAKSVMDYLIKKGIPKSTFDVQWFGFSRPIATCDRGKETDKRCQEVNALNRRCEVYIKRIK
jgi:outer membrane protein OmpA-like peptidoglycan-associated protein